MSEFVEMGRLAMREEGTNWNAYYAMPGTMEGSVFLGSIRMAAVRLSPNRKQQFENLMRDVVADILQEAVGQRPTWKRE